MNILRREKLKEFIRQKQVVSLKQLTQEFNDVSVMTLHRDLDYLAKEGFILRIRGGAKYLETEPKGEGIEVQDISNKSQKDIVAQKAVRFVKEGSSIFLDGGTTMLELEDLPRRLVILGGGYIALEFASFYAEFGSRVTILERGSRFLAREDADVADSVRKALENKGVTIITGASASAVRDAGDEAEVRFILDGTEQALPADAILLATGRRPLTAGLNLEAAGVKTTEQGAIAVDERLQTSVPHIWALGDVKGGPQFTYISLDDFRIVRDALYGEGKRVASDRDPAYTVFMDPPLGRVGLTEQAARDKTSTSRLPSFLRQPSPAPG